MSRIINILGGILLLACVVLGYSVYHEHSRAVKAEAAALSHKADAAAGTTYIAEQGKAVAHKEKRSEDYTAATATSVGKAWAAEPVPDAISDLLRKPHVEAHPVPQ